MVLNAVTISEGLSQFVDLLVLETSQVISFKNKQDAENDSDMQSGVPCLNVLHYDEEGILGYMQTTKKMPLVVSVTCNTQNIVQTDKATFENFPSRHYDVTTQ